VALSALDDEDRVLAPAEEEDASLAAPSDDLMPSFAVIDVEEPARRQPERVADPELTPEQREIQFLKDQLAKLTGAKDVMPIPEPEAGDGEEVIRIHFLEDGLTVNGRVMYRGDELEFPVGGRAHKDTYNRTGYSWLDLRNDEFAQVDRYGKIMFRNGPWPGKSYAAGSWEALRAIGSEGSVPPPSEEEIAAAEKARKRRAAPRLPSLTKQ
jgi:hypothetical protein